MPQRPKRPCRHPGCPSTQRSGTGFCSAHARDAQAYDRDRPNAAGRGYDRRWRTARLLYLAYHPVCVLCQEQGRATAAVVVDHIVPHHGDMSLFWDESNWQSLCIPCHTRKTGAEARGPAIAEAKVYLVTGAPCSGKSTWVKRHASRGSAIWDYDSVVTALTGQEPRYHPPWAMDVVLGMREAFMDGMHHASCDAYVIYTAARRAKRQEFSRSIQQRQVVQVLVHPSLETCLQRAKERANHEEIVEVIGRFYGELELEGFDRIEDGGPFVANTQRLRDMVSI